MKWKFSDNITRIVSLIIILAVVLLLWNFIRIHKQYNVDVESIDKQEATKMKELEKSESAMYQPITAEDFSSKISRRVSDLADKSSVNLKGVSSRKSGGEVTKRGKKDKEIVETSCDVSNFTGELNNVLEFLYKLKKGNPPVKISKLSLRRTTAASIQGSVGVVCSSPGWPREPKVGEINGKVREEIEIVREAFMPLREPTRVPKGEIWKYKWYKGTGDKLTVFVAREPDPKKEGDDGEERELREKDELCGWRVDLSRLVNDKIIVLHRGRKIHNWSTDDEIDSNKLKFAAEADEGGE